jgi:hypothetical protein
LTSTSELLSPAKSLFDNPEQQYPLSFELVEFTEKDKRALWKTFKRTGEQIDYAAHRVFSNTDRANIFAESFSKIFTRDSVAGKPKLDFPRNPTAFTDIEFSEELVLDKLRGLDKTKSSGPDGITASVLKTCADILCRPLSMLFRQSFDSGVLSSDWKTAIICSISKKGDKFDPGNYRPVSLTSLGVKIMESIIYDTTMKFLVEHRVIPVNQYGFMPGKSITSNRLYCLSDWTKLLDLGRSLDVVYFDFAKAFDRLPIKLLLLNCNISVSEAIFFIGLTPFSVIVFLGLKLVACLAHRET